MQFAGKTILITLIASWSLLVSGFSTNYDSLRYELLMNSKMLKDINVNDSLTGSLEITSNKLILLSTNYQYYLLGWGGMVPFGKRVEGNISSFAFTRDSSLLTIRNNELCYLDSTGSISVLYKLPDEGMGISAGEYVMYVYDRNKNKEKDALYVVAKGGKYSKLFDIPTPITSVVEISNSLLFASGSALLQFNPKDKILKVLLKLEGEKEIKSIAVDKTSNRIFFSTESAIYALKDSSAVIITNEFGGVLRYFNDGLIVFNPEKKFLFRISGFENDIVSKMQTFKPTAKESKPLSSSASVSNPDNILVSDNQTSPNISTSTTNNTISKRFYIIAGSYPTEQQADDAVSDLKRKGFPDAEVVGKNSYGSYRFAYKGYDTNAEASKDLIQIRQTINTTAWIFEKK